MAKIVQSTKHQSSRCFYSNHPAHTSYPPYCLKPTVQRQRRLANTSQAAAYHPSAGSARRAAPAKTGSHQRAGALQGRRRSPLKLPAIQRALPVQRRTRPHPGHQVEAKGCRRPDGPPKPGRQAAPDESRGRQGARSGQGARTRASSPAGDTATGRRAPGGRRHATLMTTRAWETRGTRRHRVPGGRSLAGHRPLTSSQQRCLPGAGSADRRQRLPRHPDHFREQGMPGRWSGAGHLGRLRAIRSGCAGPAASGRLPSRSARGHAGPDSLPSGQQAPGHCSRARVARSARGAGAGRLAETSDPPPPARWQCDYHGAAIGMGTGPAQGRHYFAAGVRGQEVIWKRAAAGHQPQSWQSGAIPSARSVLVDRPAGSGAKTTWQAEPGGHYVIVALDIMPIRHAAAGRQPRLSAWLPEGGWRQRGRTWSLPRHLGGEAGLARSAALTARQATWAREGAPGPDRAPGVGA